MKIIKKAKNKKVRGYCFAIFDGGCKEVCSNNCREVCNINMGETDNPDKK